MGKRVTWSLSITPRRKKRVKAIAVALCAQTNDLVTVPEAIGILIDEKFKALGLTDDEPAVTAAGHEAKQEEA